MVVVGDAMLDRDVDGVADRVCPDTPAMVLHEQSVGVRPGGAALAAVLAARQGAAVTLVTTLAEDGAGRLLRRLLESAGVEVCALPLSGPTPQKIRLRADGRVLLRLDRGGSGRPAGPAPPQARTLLREAAAVLVSDYGAGLTGLPGIRRALATTAAPVVWDPHPRGERAVPGATLLTPSEAELYRLSGAQPGTRRLASLAAAAGRLLRSWRAGAAAVTLGADGALLCQDGPAPQAVPAPTRGDGDACGAGDRFAAAATVALAGGALVSEAVQDAVSRSTGYVVGGGPATVTVSANGEPVVRPADGTPGRVGPTGAEAAAYRLVHAVRAAGGTVVATGGCFDLLHAGHVSTLRAARRLGDCLVVLVNSDRSVARLKGPGRPVVPLADRMRLLAELECVDAVVPFDEPTPEAVLARLRPDVWVKGGDYAGGDASDLPEAATVAGWGGQTVTVPYLAGRSTTGLLEAVRAGTPPEADAGDRQEG